jgi:hypothetical protein
VGASREEVVDGDEETEAVAVLDRVPVAVRVAEADCVDVGETVRLELPVRVPPALTLTPAETLAVPLCREERGTQGGTNGGSGRGHLERSGEL